MLELQNNNKQTIIISTQCSREKLVRIQQGSDPMNTVTGER